MPFLLPLIPAVIGAGAAIYSANQQSDAANTAANATTAANAASLQAQNDARNAIIQQEQPFVTGGTAAYQALLQRLGVTDGSAAGALPPSAANTSTYAPGPTLATSGGGDPALRHDPNAVSTTNKTGIVAGTPTGGAPAPAAPLIDGQSAATWDAYLKANPDVAAWAASGHGDPALGPNQTPEQAAAYHYTNGGQAEGRALPVVAADPSSPTPTAPTGPAPVPTFAGQPTDPNGAPIYTRPTTPNTPTFGPSPTGPDVSRSAFEASPYYQMGLATGQRNLNANFGARGLLQSGAAIQGAINYGQTNFATNYGNFFNQQQQLYQDQANQFNTDRAVGLTQFNTDQNRVDNNFNTDSTAGVNLFQNERNYNNNVYNTATGNLFNLATIGATAGAATNGANTNFANNATALNTSNANAAGTAANANASANSSAFGSIAGGVSNYLNTNPNFFGNASSTSGNIGTPTQPSYAGGY